MVILMGHEDDKQKMYDSLDAVYHSSSNETFNFIKAECAKSGTAYKGLESAESGAEYWPDARILEAWERGTAVSLISHGYIMAGYSGIMHSELVTERFPCTGNYHLYLQQMSGDRSHIIRAKAIKSALQLHQAGRLDQAESAYKQILKTDPEHPDALHLLGMVAYQRGKLPDSSRVDETRQSGLMHHHLIT